MCHLLSLPVVSVEKKEEDRGKLFEGICGKYGAAGTLSRGKEYLFGEYTNSEGGLKYSSCNPLLSLSKLLLARCRETARFLADE
jgi:hypothetical protein